MKVRFKFDTKDFAFQEGDHIKIIATSFLYATEREPERIYEGELVEAEDGGIWVTLTSSTHFPFSETERQQGVTDQISSNKDEFIAFADIEDVLRPDQEYPNRTDPLVRFALDGPPDNNSDGK